MDKQPETVLLRNIDSNQSKAFEPAHAKRLLAMPDSRWREIDEPAKVGLADLSAGIDHHARTLKKALADAAKKSPVAAAAVQPEVDTTGQPTTV